MLHGRLPVYSIVALVVAVTISAAGQSVISTHSGVVHFFEGNVYIGDQRLEPHPGRFSTIPQGAELMTADGRAEVLLTPGVILRMGERSTIRLTNNSLANTRVELLAGSAVVDSSESTSGTSATLLYKNWSVRSPGQGSYRVDAEPPCLRVLRGEAEVSDDGHVLLVKQGMSVPFAPVLVQEASKDQPQDTLGKWAEGRQQSISADNAIAANIQDPASITVANSAYDGFTQYPMLGLSSMGPTWSSPYNSSLTYQPGFNSVYLPGYTYLPLLVGLYSVGPSASFGAPYRPAILPFASRSHLYPTAPVSSYSGSLSSSYSVPTPTYSRGPGLSTRPIQGPVSVHPSPAAHAGSGLGGHMGGHR